MPAGKWRTGKVARNGMQKTNSIDAETQSESICQCEYGLQSTLCVLALYRINLSLYPSFVFTHCRLSKGERMKHCVYLCSLRPRWMRLYRSLTVASWTEQRVPNESHIVRQSLISPQSAPPLNWSGMDIDISTIFL